jgi:NAD(P)-dependent dehydrogenase (short-subunit alcohol dehydrogenase family)
VRGEGLKGLVNNAGIAVAGPLEFLGIDKIRQQLETNVIGQIAVTQAFLPMIRAGKGRIVNMGSIEDFIAMPFIGPYCASKSALKAITDTLRMELKSSKIPVILIEPGIIATPLLEKSISNAEESVRSFPLHAHEIYGGSIAAARKAADRFSASAMPVDKAAAIIAGAITAKKPKRCYRVGWYSRSMGFLTGLMPGSLRDWIICRQMGMK